MNQTMASYYLYRLAGALVPFIPSRLGYPFFSLIGEVAFRLAKRERAIVRENLRHVLGPEVDEATLMRTVREVFRHLSKNYYDFFHHHRGLSEEKMRASLTTVGLEHIEEALAQGKGLVLASAHLGSPDALMQMVSLFSYKVTVPAEHLKPEALFRYVLGLRSKRGMTLLPADGPLLGLFRALRRNEIVAVAADLDTTGSGMVVDFFGAPARLPDGHVQLAMRTGAQLALAFGRRMPDNSYLAEVYPPLELEESGDFQRDVRANMKKVIAVLEEGIRQHPEQWVMFQPIWNSGEEAAWPR